MFNLRVSAKTGTSMGTSSTRNRTERQMFHYPPARVEVPFDYLLLTISIQLPVYAIVLLKVAHRFQPLLPCSIRARHSKFILHAIPNAYLPLPTPLPTSAFRRPPIPSPFLQATPRSTTIPADWQPNPGWTPKGSCRRCRSSQHWVRDCLDTRCARCEKEAPGHLE